VDQLLLAQPPQEMLPLPPLLSPDRIQPLPQLPPLSMETLLLPLLPPPLEDLEVFLHTAITTQGILTTIQPTTTSQDSLTTPPPSVTQSMDLEVDLLLLAPLLQEIVPPLLPPLPLDRTPPPQLLPLLLMEMRLLLLLPLLADFLVSTGASF
jgi:hypothetical protein